MPAKYTRLLLQIMVLCIQLPTPHCLLYVVVIFLCGNSLDTSQYLKLVGRFAVNSCLLQPVHTGTLVKDTNQRTATNTSIP